MFNKLKTEGKPLPLDNFFSPNHHYWLYQVVAIRSRAIVGNGLGNAGNDATIDALQKAWDFASITGEWA